MIHLRENGKFFTDPIAADSLETAIEVVSAELKTIIRPRRILRPADTLLMEFVWMMACAAELGKTYCIYDHEGWVFFGRIDGH